MRRGDTDGLVVLEGAIRALAACRTVDEAKHIRDLAEAARLYAKKAGLGLEAQNHAAEIKLGAERRCGALLRKMAEEGGRAKGGGDMRKESQPVILSDLDIQPKQSSRWQTVARITEPDFGAYVAETKAAAGELTTAGLLRFAHRQEHEEQQRARLAVAPPAGQYRTIVVDPPWPMQRIEREVRPRQGLALAYPTMSLDEIAAVAPPVAPDGAHVYLWTTQRFLPDAFALFARWGVPYECELVWVKPGGPTPYSWQYNAEFALFGRVGNLPLSRLGLKVAFEAPRGRHSEKPAAFYELVRQASPEPRLDMYARQGRPGFEAWGDEVAAG